MAKKVIILVRSCPYGMATAAEAYRAAIGLGAMEHEVSVIFIQDGVFAALKGQKPQEISMSDVSKAYSGIGEFGVKTYITESCIKARNIARDELVFGTVIDLKAVKELVDNSDFALSFS